MTRLARRLRELKRQGLTRRGFLRSSGQIGLALPIADFVWADGKLWAADGTPPPKRLITVALANGCTLDMWHPNDALLPLTEATGNGFVFQGLSNPAARAPSHREGGVTLFTGDHGVGGHLCRGPSIDQYYAGKSKSRSIVVAAFNANLGKPAQEFQRSYNLDGTPAVQVANPLDVFNGFFGTSTKEEDPKDQMTSRRSVLDAVLASYKEAMSDAYGLPAESRTRLSDHLEQLRQIEIDAAEVAKSLTECTKPNPPKAFSANPANISYDDYAIWVDAQMNVICAAFQCDLARSANIVLGNTGERLSLPGMTLDDHELAHQLNTPQHINQFRTTRRWFAQRGAIVLNYLKAVKDGDGKPLFDSTIVVFGSEFDIAGTTFELVHNTPVQPLAVYSGFALKKTGVFNFNKSHTTNDVYLSCMKALGFAMNAYGPPGFNKGPITDVFKI